MSHLAEAGREGFSPPLAQLGLVLGAFCPTCLSVFYVDLIVVGTCGINPSDPLSFMSWRLSSLSPCYRQGAKAQRDQLTCPAPHSIITIPNNVYAICLENHFTLWN